MHAVRHARLNCSPFQAHLQAMSFKKMICSLIMNKGSVCMNGADNCAQGVKRVPRFGGMFVQRHGSAVVVVGNNPSKGSNLSAFSTKNPSKAMVMHPFSVRDSFAVLCRLNHAWEKLFHRRLHWYFTQHEILFDCPSFVSHVLLGVQAMPCSCNQSNHRQT